MGVTIKRPEQPAIQPDPPPAKKVRPLHKTTIVIWTEFAPPSGELTTLVQEADTGEAYCSVMKTEKVDNPDADPTWDGNSFFDGLAPLTHEKDE